MREPYDEADRERALRELARIGAVAVEPDPAADDPFFAPTLGSARMIFEPAFRRRRADGTHFRAYPVIRESSLPNARAKEVDGLHLCTLDSGLVTACFELASYVFSQKDLFADLGAADRELSPQLPAQGLLGFSIRSRLAAGERAPGSMVGYEIVPEDETRRTLSAFLFHLMLRFAWLHELYHGLNGHTGLLAHDATGLELTELPIMSLATEEHTDLGLPLQRVRQAMELDADRAAFGALVYTQLADEEPFVGFREWPLPIRLRLNLFAGVLMTAMFDHAAREFAVVSEGTHPPPFIRLAHLLQTALLIGQDKPDTVAPLIETAFSDLHQLRKHLPGLPSLDELMRIMRPGTPESAPIDKALADLAALQETLAPFIYR